MKPDSSGRTKPDSSSSDLARVLEEIEQAIRSVAYGSVEVIIQNSRVVQIERGRSFASTEVEAASCRRIVSRPPHRTTEGA